MKPLTFAARSLRREFLHGELATLAAALVLAVAALAAVATLASRVERAIVASAAELIGGDLGIASSKALPDELAGEAMRRGLAVANIADFPSVVFAGDKSRLCDVRATDAAFPLRGVLSVLDASHMERIVHGPPEGSVYLDHEVLVALDVPVGGKVQVGGRDLTVGGEIARSPDGGSVFRLAPHLLMSIDDAQSIGLTGSGSRVRHRLLVAGGMSAPIVWRMSFCVGALVLETAVMGTTTLRSLLKRTTATRSSRSGRSSSANNSLAEIAASSLTREPSESFMLSERSTTRATSRAMGGVISPPSGKTHVFAGGKLVALCPLMVSVALTIFGNSPAKNDTATIVWPVPTASAPHGLTGSML